MVQDPENDGKAELSGRELEVAVEIDFMDLHSGVQAFFQRADALHPVVVRASMVEREHLQPKRFQEEREIPIGTAEIEHRIVTRQLHKVSEAGRQQRVEMVEVSERVVPIPLEVS